jgi:flagellar transcriptional activator FlhC
MLREVTSISDDTMREIFKEMNLIKVAVGMMELGVRAQIIQAETGLSKAFLKKVFKGLNVRSSKGMLPFSAEWFLSWDKNIHSSFFLIRT